MPVVYVSTIVAILSFLIGSLFVYDPNAAGHAQPSRTRLCRAAADVGLVPSGQRPRQQPRRRHPPTRYLRSPPKWNAGVSVFFEIAKETIEEEVSPELKPMLASLFGELTVLGFIGIVLFFTFKQ